MATKQRLVKLSLFAKRKSHLTEDEFHRHWTEKHRALVLDWLARHGIVKYTQYHTHSSAATTAIADFPALGGLKKLDFDGVGEFLMLDASCFQKAREDPYYEQVVMPDENQLFEWESAQWTLGWEEVYIKDGKIVEEEG
ncbi:hypothetical protein G647_04269 [Cladophialophora carrionii CBS 160.54]|uniref:EthD domain-containing protein n=1 Tax=Cladophialophora carrionii CBS 160.54 TaxID=1279043 RepID=V9DDD4_9EURO|nr:uncharacterized protein G647_04269 [Cladophialophora carrionii CBS 160.54]ETI24899.1 hypothetical protein G647_04269 [Cladophialophora carrionii CBS 160.54]